MDIGYLSIWKLNFTSNFKSCLALMGTFQSHQHHKCSIHLITNNMKKITLNLFAVVLFAVSNMVVSHTANAQTFFDKNFTGRQVEKFADGKPKYEVNIKKGKKEGLEILYYPNGSKQIQTSYVDDKEDGIWNQWYENGQLKLEAHYQAGQEYGVFTQWYDNGQKRVEANFIHGKKDGVEQAWAKDGSLKSSTRYKDGQVVAK
jgi:hypothetical protein